MTRYGCQTDILHTSVREQTADCRTLVEFCRGDGINRSLCVLDQQPEHEEFL